DEVRLGRGIFDLEYTKQVHVSITIFSNNTAQCRGQNISSDIDLALETKFEDELKKGFEVEIIFQEKEVST
ncbi:MAG: hypothetical protein JSV56_05955, partial [Methanomassiliicoccales archaeon]